MGFGNSVAYDGTMLVVGMPAVVPGVTDPGELRSFAVNQDKVMDYLGAIEGTQGGSGFGWSVYLAGQALAVGAPFLFASKASTKVGGAYVYENNGGWSQFGPIIRGDENLFAANGNFGASVAIALFGGGYRVLVGAPLTSLQRSSEVGRVYAFESSKSAGVVTWLPADQVPMYGERSGDRFGSSLDVSKDRTTFIAGAPGSDYSNEPGYVFVYQYTGKVSQPWEFVFAASGSQANEEFGASVTMLSENGDTFAIGAPAFNNGAGRVAVYHKAISGLYQQLGTDIVGEDGERIGEAGTLSGTKGDMGIYIVVATSTGKVRRFDVDEYQTTWGPLYEVLNSDMGTISGVATKSGEDSDFLAIGSVSDNKVALYKALHNQVQ